MRKFIIIILAVFMAICLALGWLMYANWNSIEAFLHSMNTTNEDTVKELEQNKKRLEDFLASEESITVRDLTEEEAKALSEGTLSEEELIEILTKSPPESEAPPTPTKIPGKDPPPTVKPVTTSPPTATPKPEATPKPKPTSTPTPTPNPDKRISELIAKLYVQKSTYIGKIDNIEAQVRGEFIANYDSWATEQDAKKELLAKYLPTVASWEKTCDDVVYGVLDEIRQELKKQGKDETIVETMRSSYREEKKLKKTYFINRYMD